MAKKSVKTIGDVLAKVNDSYTINMYDNGFMVEVSGRDNEDEWAAAKIICSTVEELVALVHEAANMERE
tara:strand:- start:306 stop:512 length:207 start_codon:yes stop_codon:yes gene_type:complete